MLSLSVKSTALSQPSSATAQFVEELWLWVCICGLVVVGLHLWVGGCAVVVVVAGMGDRFESGFAVHLGFGIDGGC
uniref:Transmembrane protein n=1 Tax=Fagus sylvatica TaxID=28930 RepID=A0A2N9FPL4_FAGSY